MRNRIAGCFVAGLLSAAASQSVCLAGQAAAEKTAPAVNGINGKWHFTYQTDGGDRENDANFNVEGERVSGKYAGADVQGTFKNGVLDLAFPFNSDEAGQSATLKMKGTLKDGKLVGNWEFSQYSGTFTAVRSSQ